MLAARSTIGPYMLHPTISVSDCEGICQADRLLATDEEPKRLNLSALCKSKGIFDIHAEIANGIFNLAVARQDLHGPQVSCRLVYDEGFGSPGRVGAIFLPHQANSCHPFGDKPSILTGAEVISMVNAARENVISKRAATIHSTVIRSFAHRTAQAAA